MINEPGNVPTSKIIFLALITEPYVTIKIVPSLF